MNRQFLAVFRKEVTDMRRDRRAMLTIFSYPLMGPVIILFMLNFIASIEQNRDNPVLAVAGASQAPVLMEYLESNAVVVQHVEVEGEPTSVPEGANALMVIDPDFDTKLQSGDTILITVYGDLGKKREAVTIGAVRRAVGQFSGSVATARLIARGIAPQVVRPVSLDVADLSTSGALGRSMIVLVIMFLVINPFVTGLSLSIDMTAGERERHSLQSLLAQPVSPLHLAMGKWAVIVGFCLISTVIAIALTTLALWFAPLGKLGISVILNAETIASLLVIMLPISLLVPGLQLFVAMSARSFKEGQMYLSFLMMAPTAIAMFYSFSDDPVAGFKAMLPVFSELNNLLNVLLEGMIDWTLLGQGTLISVGLTALFVWLTSWKLSRESLLD